MKKLTWIFIVFATLATSCKSQLREIVEETYPDGSPKVVKTYKTENGKEELLSETWYYLNGQKEMEGEYRDSLKQGIWVYWHDNGNIWVKGNFNKGKEEGVYTNYFKNGQKRYEGKCSNGERVGEWLFWDEHGIVRKKVNYDE